MATARTTPLTRRALHAWGLVAAALTLAGCARVTEAAQLHPRSAPIHCTPIDPRSPSRGADDDSGDLGFTLEPDDPAPPPAACPQLYTLTRSHP
jgi:hypothetical protein